MRGSLVLGPLREQATIVIAAALASAYASLLMLSSTIFTAAAEASGGPVGPAFHAVASAFIGIALYVAALVIAGCVATVLAGRIRHLATLRLLGASAKDLRARILKEVAGTAAVGTLIGLVVGVALADAGRTVLVGRGTLPELAYPLVTPLLIPAALAVVIVSACAGWTGSQRVLAVSPAAALTGVDEGEPNRTRRVRAVAAVLLFLPGAALLAQACRLGEGESATGLLVAFFGGSLAVLGLIVAAPFLVPRLVALFGRAFGDAPASRIARRNAIADPMRTTRATLGLVVGVALVTTFASGTAALQDSLELWGLDAAHLTEARRTLQLASTVMIGLVVMSSIIAAVGFVSTMSLVVIQRRREIGMLRAMGFTATQVRAMVTRESLALGLTAVLSGIGIGIVLGSIGAQSLVGSLTPGFVWGLPAGVLVLVVAGALALVLVAALPPAQRAVRLSPVEALRVEI